MKHVAIGVAGAVGALTRYSLGLLLTAALGGGFPWATFLINVTGSALLGFLTGYGAERGLIPPAWRLPLTVGFVGAYTTFSTWTVDTVRLFESGHATLAAANVLLSIPAGLLAVRVGLGLSRLPAGRRPETE